MSAQIPTTLTVEKLESHDLHQFNIKSNWEETEGDWNARYVCFGGFFGSYGPHVFAAAPDLLEALELALFVRGTSDDTSAVRIKMEQALKKAKGGTP